MDITERLFEMQDVDYADFQCRLTPGIGRERFIGVRVPNLRKLAGKIGGREEAQDFMRSLPHRYYEEDMLHGLLISGIADYDACMAAVKDFLPYVDNWAVCDTMSPKVFKRHRDRLLPQLESWMKEDETYTIRFGMKMLMEHFLDEDFRPEYLELPAQIVNTEYYVRMMQAWFFATALARQWDETVIYLQEGRLEVWTHNKTIQKAVESYRIPDDRKEYLKTLRKKRQG